MLSLRERKKNKTREAISSASWRLFGEQGYDSTTVEDIAAEAEISARTFFRYFDSKEAVMFGDWRGDLEQVVVAIEARPAEEPPMVVLREAAVAMATAAEADRARAYQHKKLVADASKVGNYEREVVLPASEKALAGALARRLGVDLDEDLRPAVLASTGIAAVLAAKRKWVAGECKGSYSNLVREAFDIICEAGRTC